MLSSSLLESLNNLPKAPSDLLEAQSDLPNAKSHLTEPQNVFPETSIDGLTVGP